MKRLKKIIAVAVMGSLLPALPAKAARGAAEIEFTNLSEPTLTNITDWRVAGNSTASLHPMKVGNRYGHSTDRDAVLGKGSSYGFYLDIDDNFMHNLPEGQSVKLTIEYWDGAHPELSGTYNPDNGNTFARIRAHYDSNGGHDKITEDGGAVTNLTPDFHVRNRDKWNSVSYILDDFKAGGGILGKWDLLVTDWGGETNVMRNVIYKSVKVEYFDKNAGTPLVLTDSINLGAPGNFEDIEKETLSLNIPMKNTSDEEISVDWKFEIYDENNTFIKKFRYECVLDGYDERTGAVSFKNPGLCGVYEIKASADIKLSNGNIITKYMGDENFSVAHISSPGDGNDDLGINVHAISGGHGDFNTIIDVLSRAGFGWIREADMQTLSKNPDGTWVVGDYFTSRLQYAKSKGINVLMQLWGPRWNWENGSEKGCIPLNDADRQQFGDWCEDLASQTNGYIDAFEIFNEARSTMFPGGYSGNKGEEYAKALKTAYEAIKGVNPDIPVVGPVTANQNAEDKEFEKQVYAAGGLDYMDIHSTHRYPYTGTPYVKELLTYAGKELEEEIISDYANNNSPSGMWLTEYGHNTENKLADGEDTGGIAHPWDDTYWDETFEIGYYDSVPRRTQAQGIALGYAVTQGFSNSFDKLFVHNAIDFSDLTNSEHAWGLMNSYTGAEGYTPYSAKQSLVATAAYNHFIDDTSTVKGTISVDQSHHGDWNQLHAIWFGNENNSKFDKDVIYLQTEIGEYVNVTLNVGCTSIDIYDMYGNKLGTRQSSDGKYKLKASSEPYYLAGDFTKLSRESGFAEMFASYPTVSNNVIKNCVQGTTKTFNLSNISNASSIEIDGFEKVSASSNSVTVKVPDIYEGRAYGHVKVMNSNGTLQAVLPVEMWITKPALYLRTSDTKLDIKGFAGLGGDKATVWVTNENGLPIGIAQSRTTESGLMRLSLDIPEADKEICNVKIFNGSVIINQQLIPDMQMSYNCVLDGESIPLSVLDLADMTDDSELEITLTLANNTGAANPHIYLYAACFDSEGRLVSASVDATNKGEWDGGNTDSLTVSANKTGADKIKLFVWDENCRPVKKLSEIN